MFRRMLVAVDGSVSSDWALDKAVELARDLTLEVIGLVNVTPTTSTLIGVSDYMGNSYAMVETALKELEQGSERLLRNSEARIREQLGDIPVSLHQEKGSTPSKIIDVARAGEYDLLVMGSRGKGRARGLLLGSTTQSVAANLPCSVLIVRDGHSGE